MVTGSQSRAWSGRKGRFTWGPNSLSCYQVPTFCEPRDTIKMWLVIAKVGYWLFYATIFAGFVLRVGYCFLLNPTLNTSSKPHIQQVLSCRQTSISYLGLRIWDPVWSGKSQLPCSQRLRLHRWTSSELGHRTWDLVWIGLNCKPPM